MKIDEKELLEKLKTILNRPNAPVIVRSAVDNNRLFVRVYESRPFEITFVETDELDELSRSMKSLQGETALAIGPILLEWFYDIPTLVKLVKWSVRLGLVKQFQRGGVV